MQNQNKVEQIIGKRIQKIRRAKGYTQQQFAEMIGLSTNYLSDIERGKSSARMDKLVLIINALDCTANDIFCDTLNNGHIIVSSQLNERIEKLKPKDRETAFAILEAFISKVE
ncbi:MAG: helix-turn-helix transcriptional regulator [Ruminococcaceae bacterium]|nr:helix-turn-helix transcriptional regulator [Oscillospiraceae bacterium]